MARNGKIWSTSYLKWTSVIVAFGFRWCVGTFLLVHFGPMKEFHMAIPKAAMSHLVKDLTISRVGQNFMVEVGTEPTTSGL